MAADRWRVVTFVAVLACLAVVPLAAIDVSGFDGRPTFKEGDSFGYYLWKDGDTWKVRWTTFGGQHRFTGLVRAEGGDIIDLKRIDVDAERRVVRPGRPARVVLGPRGRISVRGGQAPVVAEKVEDKIGLEGPSAIRLVARTDDDVDGFDFRVKGPAALLRFTLEIDGVSRSSQVDIGRSNEHPVDNPFPVPLR